MRNVVRTERKFLLDLASASVVQHRVRAVLSPDSHNGPQGYPVRSLYFDTVHDRDYAEKLFGLDPRRKVRLRSYGPESDFALLELKQKQGASQRKRSLKLARNEAKRLVRGDYGILLENDDPFAAEMFAIMTTNGYAPKCIVEYDRCAFVTQENNTRVTFDRNVRATEANVDLFAKDLCLYPVFDPFNVIMEVKFNGFLLSYVKSALSVADKSELSVSKYCLARMVRMGFQF